MAGVRWRSDVSLFTIEDKFQALPNEEILDADDIDSNHIKRFTLGQRLLHDGKNKEALSHFMAAAVAGMRGAMHNVGVLYDMGLGCDKSTETAVSWFKRAVVGNSVPEAAHMLGHHYALSGGNKRPDFEEGLRYILSAASDGLTPAMFDFGMVHLRSFCIDAKPENMETAMEWLQRSMVRDDHSATFELALFFSRAVPKTDPKDGILGGYTFNEDAVYAPDLDKAVRLAEHGASRGHALCIDLLANWCLRGMGPIKRDEAKACQLFRQAADKGVMQSKRDLALMIESGKGTDNEGGGGMHEVVRLYTDAANGGDAMARYRLAKMAETGVNELILGDRGVKDGEHEVLIPKDLDRAKQLMLQAAKGLAFPAMVHAIAQGLGDEDDTRRFKAVLATAAADKSDPNYPTARGALVALGILKACLGCGRLERDLPHILKTCGRCKKARYCSASCQKSNWEDHRKTCTVEEEEDPDANE